MAADIRTVSILGCGWLGTPLAEELLKKGYRVKGASTREEKLPELREKGIEAYRIQVEDTLEGDDPKGFFDADILILNIPPGRKQAGVETHHPRQVRAVLEQLADSPVHKFLFIGSSSVYPSMNREVDEDETERPDKGSGKALLEAEQAIFDRFGKDATALRLSGLVGYDRMPGRFLAQKENVKNGDAPVNLIHQDDCVGLILRILEDGHWGSIFNGVAPKHPIRKDFYRKAAEKAGLTPPSFDEERALESYKIVSGEKSRQKLGYVYRFPDPMDMLEDESKWAE